MVQVVVLVVVWVVLVVVSEVLGVVLDRTAVAALATSEKTGDRCLAAGLDKATAAAEPSGSVGRNLFIYRDRWLQIRDGLAAGCRE